MEYNNTTTISRKNKHLSDFERGQIELLHNKGYSAYKIAKELGRASNTIRNELKRGTVSQIKNEKIVQVYYPDTGKAVYEKNRKNSKKSYKALECGHFLEFVYEKFINEKWSLDACCGYAKKHNLFPNKTLCTRTLYNYVDIGLIEIKPIDLPLKVRRKTTKKRVRRNRIQLGKSIEERPIEIESRNTFGNWEIDTVIPKRNKKEPSLITITERKTRMEIILKIESKKSKLVNESLENLLKKLKNPASIFKSITSDNGLEFANLTDLERKYVEDIYYCHPNNPQERGSNEKHNSLIRRFLPKGKSLLNYCEDHYIKIMNWMNNLPRKILNYRTPLEVFIEELNNLGLIDNLGELVQFDIAI
ncbi:IS30 family transposase [Atopobacter sp. AH10]|uniref:IS30 family transposase n=1 Tax=Atopobacter sp. AH10 TaxID=2315861 RepID=UPI000EF1C8E2|nr:IS30 family transposase [Atopobacter sp. AH10]RLK62467.1 IS30 family transposase [Atopobacter sp. AH10]